MISDEAKSSLLKFILKLFDFDKFVTTILFIKK